MFNAMGVPHAAERQVKQLPVVVQLLINLGNGELVRNFIAPNLCQQRDAVPQDDRVAESFYHHIVDISLLVVGFARFL